MRILLLWAELHPLKIHILTSYPTVVWNAAIFRDTTFKGMIKLK